jgi:hypothetical protein
MGEETEQIAISNRNFPVRSGIRVSIFSQEETAAGKPAFARLHSAAVLLLLIVNPRALLGQLSAQFLMRADHGKNVVVALRMRTPIPWAGRQPCWRTSSP